MKHSEYTIKSIAQEKANSIDAEMGYASGIILLFADFVSSEMTERELKNPNDVFSKFFVNPIRRF